jgi:ArsR family transcriptional regulator, arsenate/arsenite/antimonite-responsive transcriptional repressor
MIAVVLVTLAKFTRLEAAPLPADLSDHRGCGLVQKLRAIQGRLSRHMQLLKLVGFVAGRRDAQGVRYRKNPALSPPLAGLVGTAPDRGLAVTGVLA